MSIEERCDNCKFWWRGRPTRVPILGQCRRYPPRITDSQPDIDHSVRWPITIGERDWCGEWKSRNPKPVRAGQRRVEVEFDAGTFATILWDPSDDTFERIPTPEDLFCAGQTFLRDGRLLVGATVSSM